MALTTNKKNKIIAEWKAGIYKSYTEVAKAHKIDFKTAKKILDGISQSNADIVEVGAVYENAKKSVKNPVELKAIEKAVHIMTIHDEIETLALDGTLENLRVLKHRITSGDINEIVDHKHAQNTFDQALITAGKAPRFAPKTEINATAAVQQNNSMEVKFVK